MPAKKVVKKTSTKKAAVESAAAPSIVEASKTPIKKAEVATSGAASRMPKTEEASAALVKYLQSTAEKESKNALIQEAAQVFLSVSLMQSLPKSKSMKRTAVKLPHGIYNREDMECCLITTSPQRAWKDKVQPMSEFKNIKKIIDVNKLRKKFKAYDDKRQLATQFNYFLADEAVVTFLPKILGKTFFTRSKEPVLVDLKKFPGSLQNALSSTSYSIQDNVNVSILIGNTDFEPSELAANAFAVMDALVKECPNGWREIFQVVLKGSNSPALPIYAHNYPESVATPIVPSKFPKRHRLVVPDLEDDDKPSKKQKKGEAAGAEDDEKNANDESVDLSDLEAISDDGDDEESA